MSIDCMIDSQGKIESGETEGGAGYPGARLIDGGSYNSDSSHIISPQKVNISNTLDSKSSSEISGGVGSENVSITNSEESVIPIIKKSRKGRKCSQEPIITGLKKGKPKKTDPLKKIDEVRKWAQEEKIRVDKESALKAKLAREEAEQRKAQATFKVDLSMKQGQSLNNEAKFLLYGGAKGGGKSWFLCIWMFLQAVKYKGNKLFFCRRRSVDFTNTTLETWKKSIPSNLYRINEQKKKIFIDRAKSVIDYGGLDDPLLIQALNSAEYAHIGVDQAEEIEQDSFAMLRGTLRHRLLDGTIPPYQIRLTANPAQCWLKDKFILNPEPDFAFVPALPSDNPYLPADYVDNLREAFKHRPNLLAAYLYGSWDDLASHNVCIQGSWVESAKKRKSEQKAIKRIIVNDPARFGDDENVIYVMEFDGKVASIVDSIFLEHKSLMDTAGRLASLQKKHDAQIVAVDVIGIGAGIVDALYELKIPVLAINSSSKPTISSKEKKYKNLRSQMWMEAGEEFADGKVALPDDYTLAGQLCGLKFEYTQGKIQVEGKDDIKKRLGRSPDRGDAFVMGLFALNYVDSMRDQEYVVATSDHQGQGIRVEESSDLESVGVGDDFSGYNL